MAERAPRRKRKKAAEPSTRGLAPREVCAEGAPAAIRALARAVEEDGGGVVGSYRDPLGGAWQLVVALPLDRVAPTPFQRDLSEAHLERLTRRIDELGRFLDPLIVVRRADGTYWTPNGNHRLHAMRRLGAKAVTALLVPEESMAFQILALNTEKAHNLREKALEVIRMARELATLEPVPEREHAALFEDPWLLTLGLCYEQNGRFPGGVYQPVLKRIEAFFAARLPKALEERGERATRLLALDEAVSKAVAALKERGLDSPYLKTFVVARVNPLRFQKSLGAADWDSTIDKMLAAARRFDAAKINPGHVVRSGGPPAEE
jgi:ParB family transcriptional regulator, chromosome partitioning protein